MNVGWWGRDYDFILRDLTAARARETERDRVIWKWKVCQETEISFRRRSLLSVVRLNEESL